MRAHLFGQILKEKDRQGTLEGIAVSPFWIAALQMCFPLGFSMSWAHFTYGYEGS